VTTRVDQRDVDVAPAGWELLPLRFHRLDRDSILLTNLVGEHMFVTEDEFLAVVSGSCSDQGLLARLRARHLIQVPGERLPAELLAIKLRTRLRRLPDSTGLHILVLTLRCEHTCRYCQVSRQSTARSEFDMTEATARKALDLAFRSPSPHLKLEFQGGEPLLNFPLLRWIVSEAKTINAEHGKKLAFVIATNLALLDDEIMDFCAAEDIYLSTSIDGPPDLHNSNRRRPGQDSWERTVAGIRRIQDELGPDRVSALMTTTEASLARPREIIDTYVDLGMHDVFLRPISPYGFALRRRAGAGYDVARWLEFYEAGLDYVISLNRQGIPMVENYAAIVAKKIFTNDDPGYVDLTSPAGIGIGALVYNYDGDIYASDEGRMLAEMHDDTFRIGSVDSSYEQIMLSDKLLHPLEQSLTLSAPMCSTCAFEPYCGSDPVYHHATMNDFVGHKAMSGFCERNMGVFSTILRRARDDSFARELFWRWAQR
jgi:His-Xaa-Ser system radical SAM maturase HxsB